MSQQGQLPNIFNQLSGQIVPEKLKWNTEPLTWTFDAGRLVVQPLPKTNLLNLANGTTINNACFMSQSFNGDFTLSCKVGGSFVSPGDAAALTIWISQHQWAKICIAKGKSPGEKRIVTVVSNPFSDEAQGELLKTAHGVLRISRRQEEFIMHYSVDGKKWRLVRQFAWKSCPAEINVGVMAQSPGETGQAICEFSELCLIGGALPNFGQE